MARQPKAAYHLTDAEKRDLTELIQQGKPLPEQYRFLLFEDKREVELVWNGKTSEVCNIVLPFQVIEQVDEPRPRSRNRRRVDLFDYARPPAQGLDQQAHLGRQQADPLIAEERRRCARRSKTQGGLKLIYIDPPFDVGADFSMDIEIGGDTFTRSRTFLKRSPTATPGGEGRIPLSAMIYERLILMRDLLAEDGSIYVHLDEKMLHYVKAILDEIFAHPTFGMISLSEAHFRMRTPTSSALSTKTSCSILDRTFTHSSPSSSATNRTTSKVLPIHRSRWTEVVVMQLDWSRGFWRPIQVEGYRSTTRAALGVYHPEVR